MENLVKTDPQHIMLDPENMNVFETGFHDPTIKGFEVPAFKGSKNNTYRLGIPLPERVVVARIHYHEELGYFLCHSEFKMQGKGSLATEVITRMAPCCERLELPKKRAACIVVQYHADRDGQLSQPFGYDLKIWRFSERTFTRIRQVNNEHPLARFDIRCFCEDEQYQSFTISPCKDSILRDQKFVAKYGPEVEAFVAAWQPKLISVLGGKLPVQKILEKLGAAPVQVPAVNAESEIKELLGE